MLTAIFNDKKVEIFFAASVVLAISDLPDTLHIFLSILLILTLIKGKTKYVFLLLILAFNIVNSHSFLVISHLFDTNSEYVYKTTAGTYFSSHSLDKGDFLVGTFESRPSEYGPNLYNKGKTYTLKIPGVSEILSFRKNLSEKLYYSSGLNTELINALIIGDKDFLKNSTISKFTATGLNHLLAISGLHVGIIVSIILWLTSWMQMKIRFLISMPFLIILIPFTGFKITVIRAVTFALILMTAYILDIKVHFKKMILFAASLFILLTPGIIYDISFLLSFSAVFGIVYFMETKNYVYNTSPLQKITDILKVGIAATIFTSPFILYFFGNFNYLSVLNTLIMLPFITVLIILGILYIFASSVLILPITVFEKITMSVLDTLFSGTYPFFILNKISPLLFASVMVYMLIIIMSRRKLLLLAVFLLPLYPSDYQNGIYIPKMIRSKGFINMTDKGAEIFYKGWYSDFKYEMLPMVAELSAKTFESGSINIYDGNNHLLRLKRKSKNFTGVCINTENNTCKYVFKTRSDTIKKTSFSRERIYLIYRNSFSAENIIQLSKYDNPVFINGSDVTTLK